MGKGGKGKGKSKVKGGAFEKRQRTDSRDDDPPGSCRVFVRGFDFGTTDEQFEKHMKKAGPIHAVHWTTKGKAASCTKRNLRHQKRPNWIRRPLTEMSDTSPS